MANVKDTAQTKPNADTTVGGRKRKAAEEGVVPENKKKFTDGVVELNVGRKFVTTLRSILARESESNLADMISKPQDILKDKDGRWFIDCDGEVFVYILNFLRSGTLPRQERVLEVYDLASKFRVQSLVVQLEQYFVVQYRKKIAEMKKIYGGTDFEDLKRKLIDAIKQNMYGSPKADLSIYDTNSPGACKYCPIRPANVFFPSSNQYSDGTKTLVMYELCELGFAKNIGTKKINKKCESCKSVFIGDEILLHNN